MITLAIKSQSSEKVYIYDKIRKASCGFDDNHPLVCCPSSDENNYSPHEFEEEDEDEKPWIWDTTKLNNNKYFLENSKKKKIIPKFNYGFEEFPGYEQNLVDFEDPHTRKNCPPSFEDGFEDEININSRRKQFKPIIDPHGYDSFDALYGYPAPSGFKFSKLDPTVEPPVTKRIEIDYKSKQLNSEYCGLSVNTRIVGGKDSGPGQFPWIARVGYKNKTSQKVSYRCAGSLISDRYVITAAHCVTNLIDSLELSHIRIGEVRGKRKIDCSKNPVLCRVHQDYEIEQIIPHPNYDSPKYANDIALIRISRPDEGVPLTPICLPFNNLALRDIELTGSLAIVAGWSSNIAGTHQSELLVNKKPSLQYVRLPIVNRSKCALTYAQFSANSWTPIFIQPSQICVQGRENMDACQGDSGGPLMDDGSSDNRFRYTLLGLVSFGPRTCGVSNFPGVYTRVASFLDWITSNIQL
ncbi:phenoloxidase-activating factor 3-like [Eupeodes corollae]|uniref:phenoloxidase-activating factor 3-like n=1 Tax=Eupeodes corollae TaxID=290404 RepID=UPI002492E67C|nr:phenoloxidase-activating factor 3-like [Eupeodes corollae]